MIILLSPAKNMDFDSPLPDIEGGSPEPGRPEFEERARSLVRHYLAGKFPRDFAGLMGIGEDLAEKTARWYEAFQSGDNPSRPALFAYSGAVFKNMDPRSLSSSSLDFAHRHMRILSALYGCLKPMDLIEPYRLDLKTPLAPDGCSSLTAYWKEEITAGLNRAGQNYGRNSFILNAASGEFSRAVDWKKLSLPAVTVSFKEERGGRLVTVGTYAKMARGKIIRRILETETCDVGAMKGWDIMGYRYSAGESREGELLFIRN